jgi:hypothetical protein
VKLAALALGASACRADLVIGDAPPDAPPALPNLAFVPGAVLATPYAQTPCFDPHACEVAEGCVGGSGDRLLLRFDALTANLGAADLDLGPTPPRGTSNARTSGRRATCTTTCAASRTTRSRPRAPRSSPATSRRTACATTSTRPAQSRRASRARSGHLGGLGGPACQWIDVTDVPGQYTVRITVNPDRAFAESDYDDDETTFTVVL